MESLHYILLETERNYNNTEKLGDLDIVVNVNIDDVASINRRCFVKSAPSSSSLKKGDEVIVHHNIMRDSVKNDGTIDRGVNFIEEGVYFCEENEVIMKRIAGKGDWICLHDFVFIKPIPSEDIKIGHGLVLVPDARKGMMHFRAELAIGNKKLKEINVGDRIIFAKFSQHEFLIDGELLYKCEVQDILGIIK